MSHRLLNLADIAVGQPQRQILYGQVCQPAPTSFHDPLYVITPDWRIDAFQLVKPGYWGAIHGNALPQVGADCLINIDDRGNVWVVGWQGSYQPPAATWRP